MTSDDWNLHKRLRSFGYAFNGIRLLFSQPNACIHAIVTLIVLLAGIWLRLTPMEWCLVSLCIGGVLMAEAFNTSIEAVCDKVSPGKDPLIGRAKDLAAGAVLLMVFAAVTVGLIIFLPKFIAFAK